MRSKKYLDVIKKISLEVLFLNILCDVNLIKKIPEINSIIHL